MGQAASKAKKKAGRILRRKKTEDGKSKKRKLTRKKTEIIMHGQKSLTGVDPNNPDKVNQDRIIYRMEYVSVPRHYEGEEGEGVNEMVKLVGVCDGHGKHGHEVAQFVADNLPTLLFDTMKGEFRRGLNTVEAVLQESIRNICKQVDKSDINTELSGCTLLICFIFENYLYTCHLGDSRAVLARDNDGHLAASPLSIDHIPENDRQRIESFGGLVSTNLIEGKPTKPMLVGQLSGKEGGHFSIETSRAIGDKAARRFGLSHKPDITKKRLDGDDMFIVLASDGIFAKMNNIQAVQVVFNGLKQKNSLDKVATGLCAKAQKLWRESEDRIDDISCVIALLQENLEVHSFFQMNKFESFMSTVPCLEPLLEPSFAPSLLDSPSPNSFAHDTNWSVRELSVFKETVEMEPCLSRAQSAIFDDGYEFSVNMAHFHSHEEFDDWFSENRIASTRPGAVSIDSMNTREPLGSISRAFSRYQSESLGGNKFPLHGISEKRDTMKVLSSEGVSELSSPSSRNMAVSMSHNSGSSRPNAVSISRSEMASAEFFSSDTPLPVETPVAGGDHSFQMNRGDTRESIDIDLLDTVSSQVTVDSPSLIPKRDSLAPPLTVNSQESQKLEPKIRSPGRNISPSQSPEPDNMVAIDSEIFKDEDL